MFPRCVPFLNYHVLTDWQDLANQVRWSKDYGVACQEAGCPQGKFLSPLAGEWFSGLPRHWTDATPGAVNAASFDATFPDARKASVSAS